MKLNFSELRTLIHSHAIALAAECCGNVANAPAAKNEHLKAIRFRLNRLLDLVEEHLGDGSDQEPAP